MQIKVKVLVVLISKCISSVSKKKKVITGFSIK